MFKHHQGECGSDYATNFMGQRTTYAQLDTEVDRVARALKGFGVQPGDYVSLSLPNIKESIHYIYACWRIGAIANLIDPRTNGLGIAERARRANSRLLVTVLDICDPKIDDVLQDLPPVVVVSPVDSLTLSLHLPLKPNLGVLLYKSKKRKFYKSRTAQFQAGNYIWHTDFIRNYTFEGDTHTGSCGDSPAAVIYTSGTTSDGVIKGAVHSHRAFNAAPCAFQFMVKPVEYQRGFTFGGFVPFFSAYGAICGMHSSLCGGLENMLIPTFHPNKFADLLLQVKPNIFFGVPHFFEQLAFSPKLQGKSDRLSFIKVAISGGDKISSASLGRINETFLRNGYNGGLRIGYGSTEFGGSISVMPYYHPRDNEFNWNEPGNVGYILPSCKALVLDPATMRELPPGVDGELYAHSMSMMLEYFGNPVATAELTYIAPDGVKYYRMGDKGHLDAQGRFYFMDRYKRSIMRPDGHTVHPSPIENAIMTHDAVETCAVVGLRHKDLPAGVIPAAFVVLREGRAAPENQQAVLQEIDNLCLALLPERDRAIAYKAVDALPYTPMGKIHFRALEEGLLDTESFLVTDDTFFH
jgi:long-chain acyl-CoA synthetase